ncbi:MAG: XdhC family protein [Roseburia inulinivorans]
MNPVEFHPFEMQFEVPGTDGQTVYTKKISGTAAPDHLRSCGYVAQSLCRFASQLEFDIYAADDRPSFANPYTMTNAKKVICDSFPAAIEQIHHDEQDFVAIVTRGHKHDADCIRTLYASGITPAYMGLIGSEKTCCRTF